MECLWGACGMSVQKKIIMRVGLIFLLILSTSGFANAQSFERHPWVYKDKKVVSYINNNDFFSRITLNYVDNKTWLVWEFKGTQTIAKYIGTSTKGKQSKVLNLSMWKACHFILGCIVKKQGKKTWISFSLNNKQLAALTKAKFIKFKYILENKKEKEWGQRLNGAKTSIALFRQAHSIKKPVPIKKSTPRSVKLKTKPVGKTKCKARPGAYYKNADVIKNCRQRITIFVRKSTGYSKVAMNCVFRWTAITDKNRRKKATEDSTEKVVIDIAANGTGSKTITSIFYPERYTIVRKSYNTTMALKKCVLDHKLSKLR